MAKLYTTTVSSFFFFTFNKYSDCLIQLITVVFKQ